MVGRTISHYEIIEKLGEGGMGVVYRARDTRLGRMVAIKAVTPGKVGDPGGKRRFEQEARAASALNHPHIVHIYEIAEADGIQFIAMEFVDGKTLDQMIGGKGLRLDEILRYAVQIADALAKAHSAGIVHRDLKPSNIMVSSDGLVKVLDFGLAKLTAPGDGNFGATASISEKPLTAEGAIVGTAAYLSPEQAEGKAVDARSDLFSLGAVLYEMVTGQRAFQGGSSLATLLAILKEDPKPVSDVVADVPRDLEKIITRCLRKDPAHRFQHTEDLKMALAELKQESDSGTLIARTRARTIWRKVAWMSAVLTGLTAAVAVFWTAHPARISRPVPKIVPITTYAGDEMSPSFSPDGSQLAFAWDASEAQSTHSSDIYLKLTGESEPVRLTHDPANEFSPAWSPDGRYVAFLRTLSAEQAGVFVIPAIGGRERELADVSQIAPEYGDYAGPFLSWLPDGKSLVFARFARKNIGDLFLLHLSERLEPKGNPFRLTFEDRYSDSPAWTPDGRSIVFTSGSFQSPSLWKIGLSSRPAKPEQLPFAGEGARQPAISRRGQLAYAQFSQDADVWKLDLHGGQPSQKPPIDLISSTRIDHEAVYSSDGKRIVFTSNRSGSFEIWVCNNDGSKATQLTSFAKGYYAAGPNWSPNGRLIYFNYNPNGERGVHVIQSDGGAPRRLPIESIEGLSRDGRWIYSHAGHSEDEPIWKAPVDGGNAIRVTRQGGLAPMESPDGRYLYYVGTGAGKGLWRLPIEGGDEVRILESVFNNNYAVVDRGVYFIPNSKPFSVNFLSFDAGKITAIAEIPREPAWGFSVSPDGRSLLYSAFQAVRSDLMLVENFR